jgi:hypothetical protein
VCNAASQTLQERAAEWGIAGAWGLPDAKLTRERYDKMRRRRRRLQ